MDEAAKSIELADRIQGRLLIVDDSATTVRLLVAVLKDLGEIRTASDGETALIEARSFLPDVMLLDVEMPGMDGYEVCKRLKTDPATAHISVFFVTSHSSADHEITALDAGASDFIGKPINPRVAFARVRIHMMLLVQTKLLREQVGHDALTGLVNRRRFGEALAVEVARSHRTGQPLSLIMIDVDFFKAFNDHYGHPAGDECLRAVAGAIRSFSKRSTDLAARIGGEEFAMLLANTELENATKLANELIMAVSALGIAHVDSQATDHVTISAGVAPLQLDGGGQTLMRRADKALYEAKEADRNRVVQSSG